MHTPNPPFITVLELQRQELLAKAAQRRFVDSARQSSDRSRAETAQPRIALTLSYARYLASSLSSVAFGLTSN